MARAAVRTGEQRILAGKGDRPDRALDHVRVHLNAAIIKERDQAEPMPKCVAHGFRQVRRAGDARQLFA